MSVMAGVLVVVSRVLSRRWNVLSGLVVFWCGNAMPALGCVLRAR